MADEPTTKTVSQEEYDKAVSRAQRFEAKLTDLEKKWDAVKDIDPVAFAAMKEDYDNLRKDAATGDKTKIEQLVGEARAAAQKEVDKREKKIAELEAGRREYLVVDKVSSLAAGKLIPEALDDAKDYARRYGEVDSDGNIYFKGADGKARYVEGSVTEKMKPEHFVDWLATSKPHWAKVEGGQGARPAGTAATGGTNGGGAKTISMEALKKMSISDINATDLETLRNSVDNL